MRTTSKRAMVAIAGAAALAAPLALVAQATVVQPDAPRAGSLVQVGPIAANGFPSWYRDSTGIRLEGCWQTGDPLCEPLADEIPNPDAPSSYPDNFPGEHFYQMADASLTAGAAGTVRRDHERRGRLRDRRTSSAATRSSSAASASGPRVPRTAPTGSPTPTASTSSPSPTGPASTPPRTSASPPGRSVAPCAAASAPTSPGTRSEAAVRTRPRRGTSVTRRFPTRSRAAPTAPTSCASSARTPPATTRPSAPPPSSTSRAGSPARAGSTCSRRPTARWTTAPRSSRSSPPPRPDRRSG